MTATPGMAAMSAMRRDLLDIVAAMTYRAALRGYLLEEALAWLLRNSGYELLTEEKQDPEALGWHRGALVVHGRGAYHQVDVLGNFVLTPAFSLPIRMFLEAKYYSTPCRLPVVRNAHGVIHDVNETAHRPQAVSPRGILMRSVNHGNRDDQLDHRPVGHPVLDDLQGLLTALRNCRDTISAWSSATK